MTIKKILVVDFKTKKVTGGYGGPSGQTFIPLTNTIERIDSKRLTESIERIDRVLNELAELKRKENEDGD